MDGDTSPRGAQTCGKIWLNGVFRVEDAGGAAVPISAAKANALLALLATSPNGERTRLWLQSKLWSDRGPQQAAGSLRQALTQLRKSLDHAGMSLITTRQSVRLDLSAIEVMETGEGDFLEGMDVRDPEFEDWLTLERSSRSDAMDRSVPGVPLVGRNAPRPAMGLGAAAGGFGSDWCVTIRATQSTGVTGWFEQLFCDAAARSLRELLNTAIRVAVAPPGPDPRSDVDGDGLLAIRVETMSLGETMMLRVTMHNTRSNHQVWAASRNLPLGGAPPIEHPEVLGLVSELSATIMQFMRINAPRFDPGDPDLLCLQAIDDLFSMEPGRLTRADQLLTSAFEAQPRGLYLAWRAQLRTVQFVERHGAPPEVLVQEGESYMTRALELEPQNSMVVALAANTAGHLLKNVERSIELGMTSVRLNPANPMSGNSLSSGHMYADALELSYAQAAVSRNLALLNKHRFWWDQQLFGSAFMMGRLDESYRLARTAHALNPNFRPALRYLVVLAAHFEHLEAAQDYVAKLCVLEPDFTVARLLEDREYPASLIHRAPGLRLDRLRALI